MGSTFSGVAARVCVFALALLASPVVVAAGSPGIGPSVVRILNHSQGGSWYAPWDTASSEQRSGSGFVVAGGLIMTNAHVVSDARHLLFYRQGDPTPHQAEVLHVAHDCDLALVRPMEPGLLSDADALGFGGLPELGSTVETYGYPAGGRQIASTRGIVSRIEVGSYTHSGADEHLSLQTDAAINPGNSGGPVVQDGVVVGVAFQAAPDLENVGFFIPTEVVAHFLRDVADGTYDGYPELGAVFSTLESPAARRKAGLESGESGVMVDHVMQGSSADNHISPGDVILEIDGYTVANDGTIVRDGLRLRLGVLLDDHQAGETLRLRVLRDGARRSVELTMNPFPPYRRFARIYDRLPRYYVYAGLVFVPLDRQTLETFGESWESNTDPHLLYEHFRRMFREPEVIAREPVLMLRRLDHPVNADGAWHANLVVERVNGREINSLGDVVDAIEGQTEAHHLLEFAYYGRFIVLDREAADRAHAEILERYGVAEDRRL